ncbi:MAG TPA: zinc-dependent alcohol dehydrogenase family protein [Acidimicrobiales bacterium]|nr:zinc-dependent alcohol dehydrogenase family protein [Acidimicrobiales bacterium]
MRAWAVGSPGSIATHPLEAVERSLPEPGLGEIRVRVNVCGVCRTDLHLAEGDLAPRRRGTVPGHEVVGRVDGLGAGTTRFSLGDRVGIAWLRHTCGVCRFCTRGDENLCIAPRFTGWDDDGGYAEHAVVDEQYAYALPERYDDDTAAPLLCAGIIGYRALRRAALPSGGRLGVYGFGASAHIAAQIAMFEGATVHVLTRSLAAQRLALDLGAASAGDAFASPPEPLDAAILFAPVGDLVPVALEALDRGGTLSIAGIHLSDIPSLSYERDVFQERSLRSVTANTRRDGEELMAIAAAAPIEIVTTPYAFDDANRALVDLAADRVNGAAVIRVG